MYILGICSIDNVVHKYILHYIFLPRINLVIESFIRGWNSHPMRTMQYWSPEKTFVNGIIDIRNRHQHQIADWYVSPSEVSVDDLTWYGVDAGGPLPIDDDLPIVEVDNQPSTLSRQEEDILRTVDPLTHSNEFGIDLFIKACEMIKEMEN